MKPFQQSTLSSTFPLVPRALKRLLLAVFLSVLATAGQCVEKVKSFLPGSLAAIESERTGRPFILAFWSVGCVHCPHELRALANLQKSHPKLDIVLVATDAPDESARSMALARSFGLARAPQWIFADEVPERLRYEIDRRWYGELPRTHFYNARHEIEAVSGVVPPERLARWAKENLR